MGRIVKKAFSDPDEARVAGEISLDLIHIPSLTVGLGTAQPGFRWSKHMRQENDELMCQVHHVQMLLSGRFAVEMDDGEYAEMGPNEVFEVPPGHDAWVLGDEPAVLLDFLGNIGHLGLPSSHDRIVTTLLMTDIVESTATASRLGDAIWKQRLGEHNRIVRARFERYKAEEVNTTGDGFLVMFPGARAAIACAASIREATDRVGLPVRIGIHTGEVELLPYDIGGVAVHAAARVMALGGPSEIMVSATTHSLVDGSGLDFETTGAHDLKGLSSALEVFKLVE
jgi:class 3 adenylate cyclase